MTWPCSALLAAQLSVGMANPDKAIAPMKAIPRLDLERFVGPWHEIARLPSPAQRLTDRKITVTFSQQGKGQLLIRQLCQQPDGSERELSTAAKRRNPIEEPGRFKRRTGPAWLGALPLAWRDYWVIALDPGYGWVMLGEPGLESLWMLSRQPTMERNVLETLKSKARAMGYDLAPLIISGELRSYQPM
jgi:apolipoprotein D and lipocalin family protein